MAFITHVHRNPGYSLEATRARVLRVLPESGVWQELPWVEAREVKLNSGAEPHAAALAGALGDSTFVEAHGGAWAATTRSLAAEDYEREEFARLGDRIRVEVNLSDGATGGEENWVGIFEGIVTAAVPEAWPEGERITWRAYGPQFVLASRIITGRYARTWNWPASHFNGQECVFNEWGKPNLRSDAGRDIGTLVFGEGRDARRWTLGEMIRYVIGWYGDPSWIDASGADAITGKEEFKLTPSDVSIEGSNAAEALEDLLGRLGYSFTFHATGRGEPHQLVIFRKDGAPAVVGKAIRLQAARRQAGQDGELDPGLSEANRFAVSVDSADVVHRIVARGAPDLVVCTAGLGGDWDSELETSATPERCRKPTAFAPNPYWDQYKDVWRRYVLNEDTPSGYVVFLALGGNWNMRPRRFIGEWPRGDGRDGRLRVWVMRGAPPRWERYEGPYRLLNDRCGIVLEPVDVGFSGVGGPPIYGVQVEAAVEADTCLEVSAPEDPPAASPVITRTLRCPDYRRVYDAASKTYIYDDTETLAAYVRQKQKSLGYASRSASISIPNFSARILVGDAIRSIEGRGIDFGDADGTLPYVSAVRWRFGNAESTEILLEDERLKAAR